jgi:autotransporter translocation and assembly factor TamB
VFLTLQGRISSFTPQIYSTPPMSEGDLLALLTLGRDLNTAMHSDSKELFETEILEGLKNSYISALIGSTISTALNLDELFLSSLFDRTSGKSRAFIRVGKYIGKNIFMAYEGTMEQGQDESYIFEYRLPKGFVVNIEFKEPIKEQRIGVRYDWKFW